MDWAETKVTTATSEALLVVFAPYDTAPPRLDAVLAETTARMHDFAGATVDSPAVFDTVP